VLVRPIQSVIGCVELTCQAWRLDMGQIQQAALVEK
jgi:hypothetical protein